MNDNIILQEIKIIDIGTGVVDITYAIPKLFVLKGNARAVNYLITFINYNKFVQN